MMNDEELARSLRAALPPADLSRPSRDVWMSVVERTRRSTHWSIADVSAAAAIVIALLMFPKWFWFLAYHL